MAKGGKKDKQAMSPRIVNRKARFDYAIEQSLEVGIVLAGHEVKAVREGRVSLGEAFARVEPDTGELWIYNLDIGAYKHAPVVDHEPKRRRKLLAKKQQIATFATLTASKGATLVPLTMYFNDRGIAKIELAVARGKTHGDKRETLKKNDAKRDMQRAMTRKRIG
ncbi:MAG: SsrA-binding protein SmpB [Phycisphaera sp.]|nr:SsrA-binding protein SmpB [Phycisphaera sp.]